MPPRDCPPASVVVGSPAVAETGVVLDGVDSGIDIAELLAYALDERADVRPISLIAVSGDEVLAVHEVVDLAVRDILAGAHREQGDDLELGQREVERPPVPGGAVDVEAQLQLPEM